MGNKKVVVIIVLAIVLIYYYKSKESYTRASQLSSAQYAGSSGCKCSGMQCNSGQPAAYVYQSSDVPNQTLSQPLSSYIDGQRPLPKEMAFADQYAARVKSPVMPYDAFASQIL